MTAETTPRLCGDPACSRRADEHHAELTETRAALARTAQQLGRAEAAIERVRALHRAEPDGADSRLYCVADDYPMPCPTHRALDAARRAEETR